MWQVGCIHDLDSHPSLSSCALPDFALPLPEEAEFIFWVLDSDFGYVTWFSPMGCQQMRLYRVLVGAGPVLPPLCLCLCHGNLPRLASPGMGRTLEAKPDQHSGHQARSKPSHVTRQLTTGQIQVQSRSTIPCRLLSSFFVICLTMCMYFFVMKHYCSHRQLIQ